MIDRYIRMILAVGLTFVASCQELSIDSQPDAPADIRTDARSSYDVLAESPSRIVFNISSNTPWQITSNAQWCLPTPSMSATSSLVSEIIVNTQDNPEMTPRTAILTIEAEGVEKPTVITVVQAAMKEKVTMDIIGLAQKMQITAGDGMETTDTLTVNASKVWNVSVPEEAQSWLSAQKLSETELKISVSANTRLTERTAMIRLTSEEPVDGFDGVAYKVVQPASFTYGANADISVDPITGHDKVIFSKGELFRSKFSAKKGRTAIEFADVKMSAVCNLGFSFISDSGANYKFHLEGSNTYWFRCAGGFSWVAPIKKTYTFEEVNAIRKLEFVVEDDPDAAGMLKISTYINDSLYGSHTGRKDIFAAGDKGCFLICDIGIEPAEGDYCIFKSITYTIE